MYVCVYVYVCVVMWSPSQVSHVDRLAVRLDQEELLTVSYVVG